jgi:hypothetical protein
MNSLRADVLICRLFLGYPLPGKERKSDMTTDNFRKMALAYPQAIESAHMNHPDFRIDGKIFATLGHPGENWGMVKLTPEQQRSFERDFPGVFHPCSGLWGRRGATQVCLPSASKNVVQAALDCALQNVKDKAKKKNESKSR